MTGSDRERDVAEVSLCLRRDARKYLRLNDGDFWPSLVADVQARALLASDWLAAHDKAVAAKALREEAAAWTQGAWSDVMLPKPTPPAVPVIAYANRVGDWLRDRADRIEAEDA